MPTVISCASSTVVSTVESTVHRSISGNGTRPRPTDGLSSLSPPVLTTQSSGVLHSRNVEGKSTFVWGTLCGQFKGEGVLPAGPEVRFCRRLVEDLVVGGGNLLEVCLMRAVMLVNGHAFGQLSVTRVLEESQVPS